MSPRTPTPEPGDPADPSEEPVRRLLADARHTGPVPPEVAARLDGVLADLDAGREPGGGADDHARAGAPVADLARRRRRRAVALLAAAVVVVAAGLTTDALRGDDPGDAADSAGGSASSARTDPADPSSRATARDGRTQEENQDSSGDSSGDSSADSSADSSGDGSAAAPESLDQDGSSTTARVQPKVVRADAFVRDVRRLRSAPGTRVQSAARVVGEGTLGAGPGFVCGPPTAYGAGRLVPVRYRGGAAVLAYRVPAGRTQTVDLLQCGTAQVLRSTTLPRS